MKKLSTIFFICLVGITTASATMTPNQIISRGKSTYSSSGTASFLVDNKLGGSTTAFNVSDGSWIAINLGSSNHSKVFVNWNAPDYSWSDVIFSTNTCKGNIVCPVNYTIQKSSNSTNGINGTWTVVASVTGNIVTARGHLVDFTDASWVKMNISTGGGKIDEFEVFDVKEDSDDIWFFPGTSISANTYKGTPPAGKDFADLITKSFPGFNPVMVRGGIPCISSGNVVTDISKYLKMAGNAKYWAIEMGTNDAWGGSNYNVTTYKNNMQLIIDSCKAAGIQPIIAKMIGTNKTAAGWQVHPDYLAAIDSLTKKNNLIEGPDLYTWFSTHAGDLNSDGVHPNANGAASIQRLWAQKMSSMYPTVTGTNTVTGIGAPSATAENITVFPNPSHGGEFKVSLNNIAGGSLLQIYDIQGKLAYSKVTDEKEVKINLELAPGIYVIKITLKNNQVSLNQRLIVE